MNYRVSINLLTLLQIYAILLRKMSICDIFMIYL